jgi:uncharacterized protein (TIGR02246 family)
MSKGHVKDLNDQFIQGLEEGDAGKVAAVYASDGKLLAPNAKAMEGTTIEKFWAGAIGQGIRGAKLETTTIDERDDVAVETGEYTLLTQPGGGDVIDTGNYIVVHRRQADGAWLYGVDMFSSNRPAA